MSDKDLRDVADEVEAWADDGAGDLAALRDLARRLREVDLPGERAGDGGATLRALDDLAAGVRDLALSAGIVVTGQETAHELVELVGRWIDGAVELPVDAEGEVIHVGDELDGYGKTIEVVELRYGRSGWVLVSRDGNAYADTFAFTRHRAPTVEDVLLDACKAYHSLMVEGMSDAAHDMPAPSEAIAEFAAKLTLKDVPRLPAQRDREVGSARVWQYTRGIGTCRIDVLNTGDCAGYECSEYIMHCDGCGHEFGHVLYNEDGDVWMSEPPNYCPNCGRKVVDE